MRKDEVLILGAGPAGLACSIELHKANANFIVVEKAQQVGGLAKTYQFGEFRTDNGPHRFFSKNKYLYEFIGRLLGERWIKVDRFTRFYTKGKYYKYPLELKDVLFNIRLIDASRALISYLTARVKFFGKEPKNFEEYAVSTFGKSIADFCILNYTEKTWGLPCSELSADWAKQRIEGLTIKSLIAKMIKPSKDGPKTLVDQFYYPELGTGLIYDEIMKVIGNDRVSLETEPVQIEHDNKKIVRVILNNGELISPDYLVSSIPITSLTWLLNPLPPKEVLEAVKKLRYRSQVYLFITINKPSVSRDQWIYFPDKEVPFARISEMKNFSIKMSPEDKTSLFIEFFCWEKDEVWNKGKEELFEVTIWWLEKLGIVKREEVLDVYHIKQKDIYPVYSLEYEKNLGIIKSYLDKFENLIYIGRQGRFKYTNQDHSLEMGILAARSIIERRENDIGGIGAEQEYYERGYIK